MAGRRRGRPGRGWDAAPPRARRSRGAPEPAAPHDHPDEHQDEPLDESSDERPESREKAAERAREICLRQLAVRPRTRAELATALRRRGIADEVAEDVLARYSEVGMIDDAAFARSWVSSRHHGKGLARRALGSELRRRGVDAETVGEALGQLDGDTEADTARALVERRLRTASGDPQAVMRRLVGMLARKGYPAGLAFRVVKEALAADERTAALAAQLDPDALAEAAGDSGPGDTGAAGEPPLD